MPARPTVEVIGVHPVANAASCFLVEAVSAGSPALPDFAQFTHPLPDSPRSEWQVPYDEKLLDDQGRQIVADLSGTVPEPWPSRARVAFFFHHLDVRRPLRTPFGDVPLPLPTTMPERLSFLTYEEP
jgi:hypothetical protein